MPRPDPFRAGRDRRTQADLTKRPDGFRLEIPWCAAEIETLARYSVANLDRTRFIQAVHDLGGWDAMQKRWPELLHLGVVRGGWAHGSGSIIREDALIPLRAAALEALRLDGYRSADLPALPNGRHVRIRALVLLRPRHVESKVGARGEVSADALAPALRVAFEGIVYAYAHQIREIHVRTQPGPAGTERDTWHIVVEECFKYEIPDWAVFHAQIENPEPVLPAHQADRPKAVSDRKAARQKQIKRRRL